MKRFVQGESRTQGTLLPELLDDYIAENNPIRVIDVFVDELDLGQLCFEGACARLQPQTRHGNSWNRGADAGDEGLRLFICANTKSK